MVQFRIQMTERAKRGRPRKYPLVEYNGESLTSPPNASHCLDIQHSDTSFFKHIFTYFKGMKADDIHVKYNKNELCFFAYDHSKKSRIAINVKIDKLKRYYCTNDQPEIICLIRPILDKMVSAIDQHFTRMQIVRKITSKHYIEFIFYNDALSKQCVYRVELTTLVPIPELYIVSNYLNEDILRKEYLFSFTLPAKYFKRSITHINNYSDDMKIERDINGILNFSYTNGTMNYDESYLDNAKISLNVFKNKEESYFCDVNINAIKSVSSSVVTDDITIYCRENTNIVFRHESDLISICCMTDI